LICLCKCLGNAIEQFSRRQEKKVKEEKKVMEKKNCEDGVRLSEREMIRRKKRRKWRRKKERKNNNKNDIK
jgi:hypothetical protein